MKISEMQPGQKAYTQLDSQVLAVLSCRADGWCVYVGAVPGKKHDQEWREVARRGAKQNKQVAEAIAKHCFFPGYEIDVPYAK